MNILRINIIVHSITTFILNASLINCNLDIRRVSIDAFKDAPCDIRYWGADIFK